METSDNDRDRLWREGLPILQRLTGEPDRRARAHLGRILRDLRDDAREALSILQKAQQLDPAEANAWLAAAVRRANRPATPLARARAAQLARRSAV